MKRVLVTGAGGFIGQALCDALTQAGHTVRGAVRHPPGTDTPPAQQVNVGTVDGNTDWRSALENIEVVVHLVARTHIMREVETDPAAAYRRTNVEGTVQLARSAAAAGVGRMVFVSSIKVNGEQTNATPFSATDPPAPQDEYGRSKWAAEQALETVAKKAGMEWTVVRPPLVYGPRVRGNFRRLLGMVERERPLPLGSIHNRRSLVSVDNLCDLLRVCVDHPDAANRVFLVSDGEDLSTPELIRRMATALGRRSRLLPFPTSVLRLAAAGLGKRAEIDRLCGSLQVDIRPTQQQLEWTPPIMGNETLAQTANGYLQSIGQDA